MTKFFRLPTLIIWLTTLWVALWDDLTLGNVVSGVLVATAVVAVARPTGVTGLERTYFRPVSALVFVVYFVVQLVYSDPMPLFSVGTSGHSDPVRPLDDSQEPEDDLSAQSSVTPWIKCVGSPTTSG
jgi:hypothetical protein